MKERPGRRRLRGEDQPDKVQKLGVRTETVELRETHPHRPGRGDDYRRANASCIPSRPDSRLDPETLREYDRPAGAPGEPLLEVYSPDLVTAQQEYLIAWKGVQS